MDPVQFFLHKLAFFDADFLSKLRKLAEAYDLKFPFLQTPQTFRVMAPPFVRQQLPSASESTRKFVEAYLSCHRYELNPVGAGMDPAQARMFLLQQMMASLKSMNEVMSNVAKSRSELNMTVARNLRG